LEAETFVQMQRSPLVIAGPAQPDELIGRHDVLATLADRAARGRFVLLVAPRRYGKTTLVHRLRHDARATKDLDVIIVDLMGVQTLSDIALRLAQAWTRLPQGPLAKAAAVVLPYVGGVDVSGGVATLHLRPRPAPTGGGNPGGVLDIPRAVAERTGRRVLVVLDEFQAIASVDRADAIVRSQIQHHTDQVSYLFAGSERSTLHMLFNEASRPLYGQAEQVALHPFDPAALGDYLADHLSASGRDITAEALAAYLAFTEGHPQRSMLVADCLWAVAGPGTTVDRPHLDAAVDLALQRCDAELSAVHALVSQAQARVLRLLAWVQPAHRCRRPAPRAVPGLRPGRGGLAGPARAVATRRQRHLQDHRSVAGRVDAADDARPLTEQAPHAHDSVARGTSISKLFSLGDPAHPDHERSRRDHLPGLIRRKPRGRRPDPRREAILRETGTLHQAPDLGADLCPLGFGGRASSLADDHLEQGSRAVGPGETNGLEDLPGDRSPWVGLDGGGQAMPVGQRSPLDGRHDPLEGPGLHRILG
jgi:hypothetical protein